MKCVKNAQIFYISIRFQLFYQQLSFLFFIPFLIEYAHICVDVFQRQSPRILHMSIYSERNVYFFLGGESNKVRTPWPCSQLISVRSLLPLLSLLRNILIFCPMRQFRKPLLTSLCFKLLNKNMTPILYLRGHSLIKLRVSTCRCLYITK